MTKAEAHRFYKRLNDLEALEAAVKSIAAAKTISELPEPLCNIRGGFSVIRRWAQLWVKDMGGAE